MCGRDRYYTAICQSRSLESLHPILEFLAECFAVSAEEVEEEVVFRLGTVESSQLEPIQPTPALRLASAPTPSLISLATSRIFLQNKVKTLVRHRMRRYFDNQ
jgi:hypothetical protein